MDAILKAEELHKSYHNGAAEVSVLRGANLTLCEGEIGVVVGPSGVGKSTLLHILGLLDRADGGRVFYRDRLISDLEERERCSLRRTELGFIFQFFHLLPDLTALENVVLPGMIGSGVLGWQRDKPAWRRRAEELLERVGLGDRLRHRPSQLSGGEKQRVAIARALVHEPRIVFCDEPTGNLDEAAAEQIRALLWELNQERRLTLLIVTHNLEFARLAHWRLHMTEGRLEEFAGGEPTM